MQDFFLWARNDGLIIDEHEKSYAIQSMRFEFEVRILQISTDESKK